MDLFVFVDWYTELDATIALLGDGREYDFPRGVKAPRTAKQINSHNKLLLLYVDERADYTRGVGIGQF